VYIENWDDFQESSIKLFRSDPVAVSTYHMWLFFVL